MIQKFTISLLLFFLIFESKAQILDDSTKNVYSELSTQAYTFSDLYRNRVLKNVDTTFGLIHRYENIQSRNVTNQNLGFWGSATQSLMPYISNKIGYQSGYQVYNQYNLSFDNNLFYDSKSPISKLDYLQGGTGENQMKFLFARNINPNLNFGFHVQRLTSIKQIGKNKQRDRTLDDWDLSLFSSYISTNKKYKLITQVNKFSHTVFESGGIKTSKLDFDSLNQFGKSPILLSDSSRSLDDRFSLSLYQELGLSNSLFLFHKLESNQLYNGYYDNQISKSDSVLYLYPSTFYLDTNKTSYYRNKTRFFNNQLGAKFQNKSIFLSAYSQFRKYYYQEILLTSSASQKYKFDDAFLGSEFSYQLKEQFNLNFKFEKLLFVNSLNSTIFKGFNDYLFEGKMQLKGLEIALINQQQSPFLNQMLYTGNNYQFKNSEKQDSAYKPVNQFTLSLDYKTNLKTQKLGLGLKSQNISNFIYYNTPNSFNSLQTLNTSISQNNVSVNLAHVWTDLNIKQKLFLIVDFNYAQSTGNYNIPKYWTNVCTYYQHQFKNKIKARVGIDASYRDAFYANGYNPIIQQYYYQKDILLPSYILADVFANVKVKKATIWLKIGNITQGFSQNVYFLTPIYPGIKRSLHFGFQWYFFD